MSLWFWETVPLCHHTTTPPYHCTTTAAAPTTTWNFAVAAALLHVSIAGLAFSHVTSADSSEMLTSLLLHSS